MLTPSCLLLLFTVLKTGMCKNLLNQESQTLFCGSQTTHMQPATWCQCNVICPTAVSFWPFNDGSRNGTPGSFELMETLALNEDRNSPTAADTCCQSLWSHGLCHTDIRPDVAAVLILQWQTHTHTHTNLGPVCDRGSSWPAPPLVLGGPEPSCTTAEEWGCSHSAVWICYSRTTWKWTKQQFSSDSLMFYDTVVTQWEEKKKEKVARRQLYFICICSHTMIFYWINNSRAL